MKPRGFDPACEDLAELFIDDPPARSELLKRGYTIGQLDDLRRQLAQRIQDAVEDWFAEHDEETDAAAR
jgi:hypothetical protein